jgi:hypothetical protein
MLQSRSRFTKTASNDSSRRHGPLGVGTVWMWIAEGRWRDGEDVASVVVAAGGPERSGCDRAGVSFRDDYLHVSG